MKEFIEDSYCGLFCGACEIMLAYKKSLNTNSEAKWEDIPKEFTDHISEGEIRCRGCKTDDVYIGCKGCQIRVCAIGKGVEFCTDCVEYPCQITEAFKRAIVEYKKVLPHTEAIIGNLSEIKESGREKWISDQAKLWSCTKCGERFGWYQKKCGKCGAELKKERK